MGNGFTSFAVGFGKGFQQAREARAERERDALSLQLQREQQQFENQIAERAQSLAEQKAEFENRAKDAQALDFWSKSLDPKNDPAMRRFMLREGARRLGADTSTPFFKDFDKMLAGLKDETLQSTRELLFAAHKGAPPGWLTQMSAAVANGQLTLDQALDQARQFSQQSQRSQILGGGGQPAGQPPQPQGGTLGQMFQPESLVTAAPDIGAQQPIGQPGQQPPETMRPEELRQEALGLTNQIREAVRVGDNELAVRLEQERDFRLQLADEIQTGAREQERLEFERGQDPAETKLREELGKKTGEIWAAHVEAANQAAGQRQDFELLDELIEIAPQGGLTGRLAEAFPQFDNAAAAFTAIVNRLTPTLRVEGSGSTSDVEFDAMRSGLPRLRNNPEANRLIAGAFKAKADINSARGDVVIAFQNDEISAAEARRQIAALDRQSILSPELRALLGQGGDGGEAGGSAPSERFRFNPDTGELEEVR
ncbi:hypothetical protein [Chelativorans xinjiangense]|uniref:hypothetical protein n=1 Tax=Chelativorans xinjiangense TaxID=2681485 RepID=UPI001357470C|nr:hypothetical protein [Chelativorans xinjiangense]